MTSGPSGLESQLLPLSLEAETVSLPSHRSLKAMLLLLVGSIARSASPPPISESRSPAGVWAQVAPAVGGPEDRSRCREPGDGVDEQRAVGCHVDAGFAQVLPGDHGDGVGVRGRGHGQDDDGGERDGRAPATIPAHLSSFR